jgi:predicted O-methyltransferase YrrM
MAFRKLRKFHSQPRTLEETVDKAIKFGGRGLLNIRTVQQRSEILGLAKKVQELQPRNILEIGTAWGGTLLIWAQLASQRVISCDINDLSFQDSVFRSFVPPSSRCEIQLLCGDSQQKEFADRVAGAFDQEPVDFLFIDGDHRYEGVKRDFELYKSMVRPGGLIAFHDIVESQPLPENQVYHLWKEIRDDAETSELVDSQNQCGFGIGVLKVAA